MFVISKYGKNKDKSSLSRGRIETIIQAQKGLAGPHISLAASFCAFDIFGAILKILTRHTFDGLSHIATPGSKPFPMGQQCCRMLAML